MTGVPTIRADEEALLEDRRAGVGADEAPDLGRRAEAGEALRSSGMSVLYTTHYMEEAQRVCDRVGIMDRGRLIAEGSQRELLANLGEKDRIDLAAAGELTRLADACRPVPGVEQVAATGDRLHLVATDGRRTLPAVLEAAQRTGAAITSVEIAEADLEAAVAGQPSSPPTLTSVNNAIAGNVARSIADSVVAQITRESNRDLGPWAPRPNRPTLTAWSTKWT